MFSCEFCEISKNTFGGSFFQDGAKVEQIIVIVTTRSVSYLILIKSVSIVHLDLNKRMFFLYFKKNRIIKEIVDYCCSEKVVSKR